MASASVGFERPALGRARQGHASPPSGARPASASATRVVVCIHAAVRDGGQRLDHRRPVRVQLARRDGLDVAVGDQEVGHRERSAERRGARAAPGRPSGRARAPAPKRDARRGRRRRRGAAAAPAGLRRASGVGGDRSRSAVQPGTAANTAAPIAAAANATARGSTTAGVQRRRATPVARAHASNPIPASSDQASAAGHHRLDGIAQDAQRRQHGRPARRRRARGARAPPGPRAGPRPRRARTRTRCRGPAKGGAHQAQGRAGPGRARPGTARAIRTARRASRARRGRRRPQPGRERSAAGRGGERTSRCGPADGSEARSEPRGHVERGHPQAGGEREREQAGHRAAAGQQAPVGGPGQVGTARTRATISPSAMRPVIAHMSAEPARIWAPMAAPQTSARERPAGEDARRRPRAGPTASRPRSRSGARGRSGEERAARRSTALRPRTRRQRTSRAAGQQPHATAEAAEVVPTTNTRVVRPGAQKQVEPGERVEDHRARIRHAAAGRTSVRGPTPATSPRPPRGRTPPPADATRGGCPGGKRRLRPAPRAAGTPRAGERASGAAADAARRSARGGREAPRRPGAHGRRAHPAASAAAPFTA